MKRLSVLLLCAVLLLSACGGAASASLGPPASSSGSALPQAPVPEAANALRSLSQGNGDGYYYTISASNALTPGDARYLLHDLDYAAMRDIVLCSSPGCAHDSEACPAFADLTVLNAPFAAGGCLVDFCGPWDGAPPQIVVTELDGANRRVVHTLSSGQFFGSPVVNRRGNHDVPYFEDGTFVYFPVTTIAYGAETTADGFPIAASITAEVCRLDPAAGRVDKVADLAVDGLVQGMSCATGGDYLFGALGRELLVKHYRDDYSAFTFTAINVDTGARRDIAGWALPGDVPYGAAPGEGAVSCGENLAQVLDGKIYLPDWAHRAYRTIDPLTGEGSLTLAALDERCLPDFLPPIRAALDGWLLVDEPVDRSDPSRPDDFALETLHYAVCPDTGEKRELTAGSIVMDSFAPLSVLARAGNQVLTSYTANESRAPRLQSDGSIHMALASESYYALIPVDGLLANDQSALREFWPLEAD